MPMRLYFEVLKFITRVLVLLGLVALGILLVKAVLSLLGVSS